MNVILGNYKGFNIRKPNIAVNEEEIESEIFKLKHKFMIFEEKKSPIQIGDYIEISYDCYHDGDFIKELSVKKHNFKLGIGLLHKAFEDAIIGRSKGDKFSVEVIFDTKFEIKYLRDEKANFDIFIHSVSQKVMPELNDKAVKNFKIEGIDTVEKLKKYLFDKIQSTKRKIASVQMINDIMKRIIDNSTVELCDDEIETLKNDIYKDFEHVLKVNNASVDIYMLETGVSKESLDSMCRQEAIVYLTEKNIIEKIAELENIRLNDDEIVELTDEEIKSSTYEKVVAYLLNVNIK